MQSTKLHPLIVRGWASKVLALQLVLCFGRSALLAQAANPSRNDSIEQIKNNEMPEATDRMAIDMKAYAQAKTLADVAKSFHDGLKNAGYGGQGWSYIGHDPADDPQEQRRPNPPALRQSAEVEGFVLTTQIEQYDDQGKPLAGQKRLAVADVSDDQTAMDKVKRILFGAPVGHYRMFLFGVDAVGDPQRQTYPSTYVTWQKFYLHQYREPMIGAFQKIKLASGLLNCTVFVYEFDRASTDGELIFRKSPRLPITQHLRGSGLMDTMGLK